MVKFGEFCIRGDDRSFPGSWHCEQWEHAGESDSEKGWWVIRVNPWEKQLVWTSGRVGRLQLADLSELKGTVAFMNSEGFTAKVVQSGAPPYEWDW